MGNMRIKLATFGEKVSIFKIYEVKVINVFNWFSFGIANFILRYVFIRLVSINMHMF